jgi:hypothetical protein
MSYAAFLRLPNPTNPINAVPNSQMAAGMGDSANHLPHIQQATGRAWLQRAEL